MSLWNRILGRRNVTGSWKRRLAGPLVFDFDRFTLCNAALDGRFGALYFLGPDSDPHHMTPRHEYLDLGIGVEESPDGERFEHLTIFLSDYAGHTPYGGTFLLGEREITIATGTTLDDLRSLFADWSCEPHWDDARTYVEDAAFQRGQRVFEPSWDEDGVLYDIEIYRHENGVNIDRSASGPFVTAR